MSTDWIDVDDALPEEGVFIVTAENFDNTGSPMYDLIQVTAHVLDCMRGDTMTTDSDVGFSHWYELHSPDFDT